MKNKSPANSTDTCLILGGNSDIGVAIAQRFARERFNLLLTARDIKSFDLSLSDSLASQYGVSVTWYTFEGNDYHHHQDFYSNLTVKPDLVICVLGYLGNHLQAQSDFTEAKEIIESNLMAPISILNIIANDMETGKKGTIIGISSVAGDRGRKSNYIYGAAKAGFTTYLSGLRNRLVHHGIHVLTIKPGFVQTKMTAGLTLSKKLTASPEQVADKIWYAFYHKINVTYILPSWRWIMLIIRLCPEWLFKRLHV